MPNIASLLKSEISRVVRKEVRAEVVSLKKATIAYRSEIASLKRRAQSLESEVRRLSKGRSAQVLPHLPTDLDSSKLRFSAKGLASQRKRLRLSARECALLLGTTRQSVYAWENGSVRPRARFLQAIAALRTMGNQETTARLQTLSAASS